MDKGIWIDGPVDKGVMKFLKGLLDNNAMDAVLLPGKNKTGDSYAWFLMGKDGLNESASPFPPVMTTQGAKMVSYLTKKNGSWKKTGVLLRPCELRAAIELAKLKQVDLTNLVLISYDCPGAFPLKEYVSGSRQELDLAFETSLCTQTDPDGLRNVCSICSNFTGRGADIEIGLIGAESKGFWLIPATEQGEELLKKTEEGNNYKSLGSREKLVQEKSVQRIEKRKITLDSFQDSVNGPENLMTTLSSCINCHNCSRVCPICFCRECYFDSRALNSGADEMLQRAERKNGLRLMPDLLLFHMGRMTHMSISCVSCGACEDACPADIPVSMLFSVAARDTRKLFDYEPGRNIDEALPYSVFNFEELKDFEAPYTKEYSKQ